MTNYDYICKRRSDLVEKCLSDGANQGIRVDIHTGEVSLCMTLVANNCNDCKFGNVNNSDHDGTCKYRVVKWLREGYTGFDYDVTSNSQNSQGEITW